jgi:hypothetical protein
VRAPANAAALKAVPDRFGHWRNLARPGPFLAAIIGERPMTNCSVTDGQQPGAHGSARDEALERRSDAVREALGMGSKPKPKPERPAEQGRNPNRTANRPARDAQ